MRLGIGFGLSSYQILERNRFMAGKATRHFAFLPVRLADGEMIWGEHYYRVYTSQDSYFGLWHTCHKELPDFVGDVVAFSMIKSKRLK